MDAEIRSLRDALAEVNHELKGKDQTLVQMQGDNGDSPLSSLLSPLSSPLSPLPYPHTPSYLPSPLPP